jgi:hypothetical protein
MKRPQFSLRTLLLSGTFLGAAAGCALRVLHGVLHNLGPRGEFVPSDLFAFLMIGPLVGAGIMAPYRRTRLGAYVGFFAQILLCFACAWYFIGWHRMWYPPD